MEKTFYYFLAIAAEAVVLWLYASHLFEPKRKLSTRIIILCLFYFILFGVSLLELPLPNLIFYFVLNFIFFITQYDIKWNVSLFHTTMLTAFMGACELITMGIIKSVAPHFMESGRKAVHLLLFGSINKPLFLAFAYVLMHFLKKEKKISGKYDKSAVLLLFIPITTILVMLTFVYLSEIYTLSPALDGLIILSSFLMLVINLLVFGTNQYNQKKNMEYTEMQLLLQKESDAAEYYQMLCSQTENQRILIHDIKKHLQSINLLNEQKEHDKISDYIDQLILSSDLKEYTKLCDHDLLNSILCRYMQQCTDNHILFHVDIRCKTTDFIADTDLTALFCNLLDNAIEAAQYIPNAFIELNTSRRDKSPIIVISIINSCRKNPFLHKNNSLITLKPDKNKHGFGLKSIQKTVNKYHGNMQMYYNEDSGTFHTIITLKMNPL